MTENNSNNLPLSETLRADFLSSIVVFLVALPLCMGIAIASGVPVAAGLITGIVGGLVVATLSGCPLGVSGPAAGLTVIVFEIVQEFGFEMLGLVVLLAGAMQLVGGLVGLGQWFRAVSPAVIKGMLAGIGVLIFASQFHVMVDDKPKGNGLENLVTIPFAIAKGLTWPEFDPTEKRRARTQSLKDVGELHRRQAALEERVAERLPDHAAPEQLESETPEQVAAEAEAIRELVPTQQELNEEIKRIVTELATAEAADEDNERSKLIVAACQPVVAAAETALQSLEDGEVRAAIKTQTAVVNRLGDLSNSLKNHPLAAQIGILTIAVLLGWQFVPKRIRFLPAPLIAVIVAAGLATVAVLPVLYVEVPDSLLSEIHFPTLAMLGDAPWSALFQSAIVVAVVASAETLLCATAVDQQHQGQRTRYDQELRAQGVGNMVCGLLGALPMTAVIVRSTANVQAGGKTRLSAILHGGWLLVFIVFLAFLLRMIPTSALAAILVYTGYKLVNPASVRELKKFGWGEVVIYLATVITIVVTDLLTGVIVGVALAAAKLLYTFSHLDTELVIDNESDRATLKLRGAATFVRLPKLATKLELVPPGCELHVDFRELDYIDHACLDLLMTWAKQHESTSGRLILDWESLHGRFRDDNSVRRSNNRPASGGDVPEPVGSGVSSSGVSSSGGSSGDGSSGDGGEA